MAMAPKMIKSKSPLAPQRARRDDSTVVLSHDQKALKTIAAKLAAHKQERSRAFQRKESTGGNRAAAVQDETMRLLHELRVHQIELETQNEELRRAQREVEVARRQYQELYETVPVACCTLDERGTVLEANPAVIPFLAPSSALIGRRLALFIQEKERLDFANFCKAALKSKCRNHCEFGILTGGESPRTAQLFAVPVPQQGRKGAVLRVAMMDITDRKHAEVALSRAHDKLEDRVVERTAELVQANELLRNREHEFRLLADNVPAYFSYIATDLRYRFVNKRYEKLFGRSSDELIGQPTRDFIGEANFRTIEPRLREALAGREASFVYPKVLPNGDARWMSVHYTPDRGEDGRIKGVLALMTDVTAQKQSELALQQNHVLLSEKREELQLLTDKLFTAQDTERQRIARDLHDDFSQRLVAVALDLEDLRRNPPLMPASLGKALEPIRDELAQLSDDLRNLAHQLHPSLLKHAVLRAALEEHVHQAMKRTGLNITVKIKDVPDSLDAYVVTCLFRVFQECLQNVAKHANATEVLVKLSGSSKGIGLSVTDNGTGFDHHDKSRHQKGLGLTSMRERLRLLNGFLNIHSRPADGTKVCAWIPPQEKTTP